MFRLHAFPPLFSICAYMRWIKLEMDYNAVHMVSIIMATRISKCLFTNDMMK